jgi:hypothetical protein
MKFTLTARLVENLLSLNHFEYAIPQKDDYAFLALRGAIPVCSSSYKNFHDETELELKGIDHEHYNCTIIQLHDGKMSPFRATTVPGKHYMKAPINPKGTARLIEGCHLFQQGFHNSASGKKYAAFRQASEFPLLRDTDRDNEMDWDGSDILEFCSNSGINLHYGKGEKIGKWSAGCQVVNTDASLLIWNTFKNRIYKGKPDKLKKYHYFLFDANYVANVANASVDSLKDYERLLWNSRGDKVRILQKRLIDSGYKGISADGIFSKSTLSIGVIPFQIKRFGVHMVNGIVTQEIWRALFDDKDI